MGAAACQSDAQSKAPSIVNEGPRERSWLHVMVQTVEVAAWHSIAHTPLAVQAGALTFVFNLPGEDSEDTFYTGAG